MTFNEFHNALRTMKWIEHQEILEAGATMTPAEFQKFESNPYKWFIAAPTDDAKKVWSIIQQRQPQAPGPRLTQTHTYAELEVSAAAYDEIAGKLREAEYHHAFNDGTIDMHGIGLTRERS